MFALFHILKFGLGLLLIPFGLLFLVFWIWMLIHAVTNNALGDGEKIAWVLIILFLHFLGALIYFFVGRPKATAAGGVL